MLIPPFCEIIIFLHYSIVDFLEPHFWSYISELRGRSWSHPLYKLGPWWITLFVMNDYLPCWHYFLGNSVESRENSQSLFATSRVTSSVNFRN